ncbi:probable 6-phosphogluconolactonase 4 chloroplastic [Phtheirospermum japonicum]|uniref:Probable 6-phosphogluconolactonase 4 chloroplastic n=1 Tax=Phtheirospermum japonicum TaxID=374723 RepID=A0A830CP31_9LAMI|nr:probable 6-phosphogluconolactonase 4 chloroplastic [Phtheirospermum japonicum]
MRFHREFRDLHHRWVCQSRPEKEKLDPELKSLCDEVSRTLRETGALLVKDPRGTAQDNDRFLDMMERYFEMPDDFKLHKERPQLHYHAPEGFAPRCASRLFQLCQPNIPKLIYRIKLIPIAIPHKLTEHIPNLSLASNQMALAPPPLKTLTKVLKFNTEEDVAVALAKYTADLSEYYIKAKGSFSLVLSGGTLIDTLRKLVEPPYKETLDWSKWLIFWVDERVVPLDHEDSNYLLASRGFLSNKSPEGATADYENRLKELVSKNILPISNISGFPKFDLMLLGMRPDGHRYEKEKWVTFITDSPKPPPPRITFTLSVINSASEIAMIALGTAGNVSGETPLPCTEVSAEGELTWFLDKDIENNHPDSFLRGGLPKRQCQRLHLVSPGPGGH